MSEQAGGRAPEDLRPHLSACSECARFARRLEAAAAILAEPRGDWRPGPEFAPRVVGALPGGAEILGWAALRLMPVTLALAAVLSGWCLLATPAPSALVQDSAQESVTDDPLTWVLEASEGETGG